MVSSSNAAAQDEAAPELAVPGEVDLGKISYFLGVSFGQRMGQNGFEPGDFEMQRLVEGVKDGLEMKDPQMDAEELAATQMMIQSLLQTRMEAMQAEAKKTNDAYLAKIKNSDGIKELSGGLLYKELTAGDGKSPGATDTVQVDYTGKLIDGTVFDSSVERGEPATFRVNQVIKGWQMALKEMSVGDKWMLYIPSELAYGTAGSPPIIAPNAVLTFEVELLGIQ